MAIDLRVFVAHVTLVEFAPELKADAVSRKLEAAQCQHSHPCANH